MLVSECSSGCESGWTLYFEHSMDASHRDPPFLDEKGAPFFDIAAGEVEDEEEDLSMVSDASSGPPHLHEEEEEEDQDRYNQECFNRNSGGLNKKKCGVAEAEEEDSVTLKCRRASKRKKKMGDHHPSFLDDTASSPLINFFPSEEFMLTDTATPLDRVLQRYPHGFSTPDFEGRSASQHQFGTSQPCFSSHQFQKNNQRTGRKKMEP